VTRVFEEKNPFIFKVEWTRSTKGGFKHYLAIISREFAQVLTLEIIRISRIHKFLCVVWKGENFTKVSGTKEDQRAMCQQIS
jgi:hypothetical protein